MLIANPIYDVVFKYLMEDKKIAKIILSSIIDEEIISLAFLPKEKLINSDKASITVKVMDFSAHIKTSDGKQKQVIIELQKAKYPSDVLRFRRYLGGQYISKANLIELTENGNEILKPLPIITIYILGHKLDTIKVPFVKVNKHYTNGITGDEIKEREDFIECLTHNSYVIQIPYLQQKYQNDIEILLSIFDQSNIVDDKHILNVNPEYFPEKYAKIIRRLQQASAEEEVREEMDFEDEMLADYANLQRVNERNIHQLKENKKELENKDKELENKEIELNEQKKKIEELTKQINHK